MSLPQGADYSLTESALIPFQAEPTHEQGHAPGAIVATKFKDDDAAQGIAMQ
jgi:hypothetical protein